MTTENEFKFLKIIEDQARQISTLIETMKSLTSVVEAHEAIIEELTTKILHLKG